MKKMIAVLFVLVIAGCASAGGHEDSRRDLDLLVVNESPHRVFVEVAWGGAYSRRAATVDARAEVTVPVMWRQSYGTQAHFRVSTRDGRTADAGSITISPSSPVELHINTFGQAFLLPGR